MAGVAVIIAAASLYLRASLLLPGYLDATRIRAERVLVAGNIVTTQIIPARWWPTRYNWRKRGRSRSGGISTVIKSLIIYPSPDPRDVTAYVNGTFQLSWKGRRPLPATLTAYREQIRRWSHGMKRNPRAT